MVVVGGGYIGLEMGSVWSRLGAEVQVVEFLDHITPGMDKEISSEFMKILKKQGIKFNMQNKVEAIQNNKTGAVVSTIDKEGKKNDLGHGTFIPHPPTHSASMEKVSLTQ